MASAESDLRGLVERALERSANVQEAEALVPARSAEMRGATRWIRSEPRLSARAIDDRVDSDLGAAEQEYELSAEIWIPGERSAARDEGAAGVALAEADVGLAQLAVAGEVRDVYWNLVLSQRLLGIEKSAVADSFRTRDAVRLLVESREVPPNDLRLAEAAAAQRQVEFQRASAEVASRSLHLMRLTGVAHAKGEPESRYEADGDLAMHPAVLAAQAQGALREASAAKARRTPGASPELGIVMKRERMLRELPYDDSVGLRFSIPLWSSPEFAGRRIEAEARALGAGINVERTRELVEAELTNARRGLEFASRSLELAKLRDQELTAYLEAQDRAYQAGELSLLELQRARTEALDARRALVEAQTQVEREISMLNQAWGRLP
ncbi:MAG: hypothetical protein AMXMBFR37_06910 [Steroidobacteraceae bacterium]